jgi:hypothetical protein
MSADFWVWTVGLMLVMGAQAYLLCYTRGCESRIDRQNFAALFVGTLFLTFFLLLAVVAIGVSQ